MGVANAHSENNTMSGDGVYSLATKGAKQVIDAATPMVIDAINNLPESTLRNGFTLSDMGCADAGNSIEMIAQSIEAVHKRSPNLPVSVVYTDQPHNDFNALVANVYGFGPFESYIEDSPQIFPLLSGASFYRQILPELSLNIGFSATAMHWLSRKVCNISDHVQAVGAIGDELQAFMQQAQSDWRQILMHRARELKPGGKLVLVNFATDEQGRYPGNTGGVNMLDTLNSIWISFVEQGRITQQEYENMTLPQYYNSIEEFSAPFLDENEAVYQAGLRLDSIDTHIVKCPFAEAFLSHGDAERFASAYIPTIRSWSECIFFDGLTNERSVDERRQIIEEYYSHYRYLVESYPEGHGMDSVHAYMVISKVE